MADIHLVQVLLAPMDNLILQLYFQLTQLLQVLLVLMEIQKHRQLYMNNSRVDGTINGGGEPYVVTTSTTYTTSASLISADGQPETPTVLATYTTSASLINAGGSPKTPTQLYMNNSWVMEQLMVVESHM